MSSDVISLLQRLIQNECVNTGSNDSGHEHRSVATLQEFFGEKGEVFEPAPGRQSVVYKVPGTDPDAPSLALVPHLDVVPVEPAGWVHDPFGGAMVDGFIYGRGAVDMLNITAAFAIGARPYVRGELAPRGDLIFAAVADEEAGGIHGAYQLVKNRWDLVGAEYLLTEVAYPQVLSGSEEPIPVAVAEKGSHFSRLTTTGVPGHGSAPYGADNALEKLIQALDNLNRSTSPVSVGEVWSEFVGGLLSSDVGGLLLYGRPKAFAKLDGEARAAAILKMARHHLSLIRGGVKALKTLTGFLWVSTEDVSDRPISWAAMGYPGPDGPPPDVPKPISTVSVTSDTELICDVVVVGTGAGGGTVAGVLASSGLDVVILEAGEYHNESDFTHLEADAYRDMYLDKTLSTTADGGILILSGAALGGGTVINYTTSFSTQKKVKEEWDRVGGFRDVFTGEDYARSIEAVKQRLDVNQDHGWPSTRDTLMEKGLRDLGWHVEEMPRNVDGCTEEVCGYCTLGCRIGAKRSTLLTYLQDAADGGARFITGAYVDSVFTDSGMAGGVMAKVGDSILSVKARVVVLAAGALNTPAILLRSGLGGPATGDYLRLHPVTGVWARFGEPVDPWTGILQTRYSDEFADLDGKGYGFRFETAPVHPLFPAGFIGWESGEQFKRDILGLAYLDVGGILLRDRDHGKVVIRKDGSPVWKYAVSKYDQAHIREGVKRATEIYRAAGADEVIASTIRPVRWRRGGSINEFMSAVDGVGYGSNQTSYFTFHQMGSARMGSDPATSVVDSNNQVHGVEGLYVMDGSCFPTPSGVNPMLSIASIAHRGATLLAEKMG